MASRIEDFPSSLRLRFLGGSGNLVRLDTRHLRTGIRNSPAEVLGAVQDGTGTPSPYQPLSSLAIARQDNSQSATTREAFTYCRGCPRRLPLALAFRRPAFT